jgi:hypothetical protein
MNTKQINYYGIEDNYIHLKFGDCCKAYNFTPDFIKEYPQFAEAYAKYFEGKNTSYTDFKNPFQVVTYVFNKKIPVNFYYNYTDEPAGDEKEIIDYLLKENNTKELFI